MKKKILILAASAAVFATSMRAQEVAEFLATLDRAEAMLMVSVANTVLGRKGADMKEVLDLFVGDRKLCNGCFFKRFKRGTTSEQLAGIADLTQKVGKHLPVCLKESIPWLEGSRRVVINRLGTVVGQVSEWKPWAWNALKKEMQVIDRMLVAARHVRLDDALAACEQNMRRGDLAYSDVARLELELLEFLKGAAPITARYCPEWEMGTRILDIFGRAKPLHKIISDLRDELKEFIKDRIMNTRKRTEESGVNRSCAEWAGMMQ